MRNHGVLWFLFATLLFTVSACKDPKDIGLDVLPAGEQMGIAWIDTFTIEARTVNFDSVRTSGRSTYIIGDFNDPIFGEVKAQVFTQFLPSTQVDGFGAATLDSIVLNLVYSGTHYGRTDKLRGLQRFVVSEVTEDLIARDELNFYSDDSYTIDQFNAIAEIEFTPDLLNDIPTKLDTVPPSFRVRLSDGFGDKVLGALPATLASDEEFIKVFKGLNIRPATTGMPPDNGALLYFNMTDPASRVELYYKNSNGDALIYLFEINSDCEIFTSKESDLSSNVDNAINTGITTGNEKLYLQSFAGTRIRVELPHLRELNELGYIAINKAELVLPVDETSLDDHDVPPALQVVSINQYDSAFAIIDVIGEQSAGIDYYGGLYDSDKKEYVFNISRYLQQTLNDAGPDYGFYISPVLVIDGSRVVLNGPKHTGTGDSLKLRMTYTIIE